MRRRFPEETLTEDMVVEENRPFVRALCSQYGRRLDPEEREAIALEAFLYAVRA